ncbi:MAG: HutD family protein [Dongiaceae bacterium]
MSARLIRPDAHRVMAWKNGGGTTAEIAVAPDGAALAGADLASGAFLWRLSLARIERDGPFSAFPGIDRTIMLVEGAGMTLSAENGTVISIDCRYVPQDFPGEWPVDCRLADGPVRDLNLMVNRARGTRDWEIIELGAKSVRLPARLQVDGGTLILHMLAGQGVLSGIAGIDAIAAGDSIVADAADIAAGATASGSGTLFLATIAGR